jgi:hypothetical protein
VNSIVNNLGKSFISSNHACDGGSGGRISAMDGGSGGRGITLDDGGSGGR